MKAIAYDRFGGIDELHQADLPEPTAGKGIVLVAVTARSINVIDARTRRGEMGPLVNKKFPKIPGIDFAGTVVDAGDQRDLSVGMRVFGAADAFKGGSFAERIAVPAGQLAPLPEAVSDAYGAALPIAGLAALYALRERGQLRSGEQVLIHGASGPVGLYAVQLAKLMGARVTAVGGEGIALAGEFGADAVVDYRAKGNAPLIGPFDVILNASGKMPFAAGRSLLAPRGRLVEPTATIALFLGSKLANLFRRQRHLALATVAKRADLEHLAELVAAGKLKTTIAESFPFDRAIEAFARAEAGGAVGKLIVTN